MIICCMPKHSQRLCQSSDIDLQSRPLVMMLKSPQSVIPLREVVAQSAVGQLDSTGRIVRRLEAS
jgi:hypothetical protein